MSGLGVLRKPFAWKFGYPRFSKKVKYSSEADLQKTLDAALEESPADEEELRWREALAAQLRAAQVLRWHFDEETVVASSNANTGGSEKGVSESSTSEVDLNSPSNEQPQSRRSSLNLQPPVDVFLSLGGGEGAEPISPDNNIYEVPPGAIELSSLESNQENLTKTTTRNSPSEAVTLNLEPPAGFGDYRQPVKPAVYATVIKPCRRGRPSLAVMLPFEAPVYANLANGNEMFSSSTMNSSSDSPTGTIYANLEPNDDTIYENVPEAWTTKTDISKDQKEEGIQNLQKVHDEILVDLNYPEKVVKEIKEEDEPEVAVIDQNKSDDMQVLVQETTTEKNNSNKQKEDNEEQKEEEETQEEALAPCIQISEDGTWDAVELPVDQVEEKRKEIENEDEKSTFLTSTSSEKIKMRQLEKEYGSQFYVPILNSEDEETDPQEAARVRKQVIESQAVRAKRINSWVKEADLFNYEEDQEIDEELLRQLHAQFGDEDIIYDSIVQNKHKTKTYWEQLMAAAAAKNSPRSGHLALSGSSTLDTPKVVDATSKTSPESVIEREIRQQREREIAVAREREAAVRRACTGSESPQPEELQLPSINNTDEGNCSEYGSEGKELSLDGTGSRVMSPEVPAQNGLAAHQRTQSLDSMSSGHSSGSGSGSGTTPARRKNTVKPYEEVEMEQPLQPYSDPAALATISLQDDQSDEDCVTDTKEVLHKIQETQETREMFLARNLKETPIEREIRLSREREDELRREKLALTRGSSNSSAPTTPTSPTNNNSIALDKQQNATGTPVKPDRRKMQLRFATNRIQQEIDEATEREKELREVGKIQTISMDTVDEKVRRIGESLDYGRFEFTKERSQPTTPIKPNRLSLNKAGMQRSISISQLVFKDTSKEAAATWINRTPFTTNKRTPTNQKGLMRKFLASHGKLPGMVSLGGAAVLNPNGTSGVPPSVTSPTAPVHVAQLAVAVTDDEEEPTIRGTFLRRGYRPAGEIISSELKEMQRREEELRLQRAHQMARSQPNLLCLDETDIKVKDEKLSPNEFELSKARSNPNLLDEESDGEIEENAASNGEEEMPTQTASKLIGKFETLIQKNIEN